MTASLFESGDSFSQVLKDTSTRSLMSIDLGPFHSLDGLLGESLKSSSSLSPPRTEELSSSSAAAAAAAATAFHHLPPRPTTITMATRSNSAAERFMKSMTAILQTKPSSSSVGNRTAVTASTRLPLPPVAPPLVVVGGGGDGAGRKRSVSSSSTMMSEAGNNLMDSQSWNNLGDYGSVLEQVNYKNVFQTTNTNTTATPDVPEESSSSLVQQDNDQQQDQPTSSTKSQAPPTTLRVYHVPTKNDVLCGKGGRSNNHVGNQRYLKLKDAMQVRYLKAAKNEKKAISQELVDIVQQQWKGRFLKMEKGGNNQWYQVDDEAARKKCSQALREINTAEKRAEKRARYNK